MSNSIGIEIGSVSIKYIAINGDNAIFPKFVRHEGNPVNKALEFLLLQPAPDSSSIVITGQPSKVIFDLPYRSEIECIEKALSYHNLRPDILLSLGGENFIAYLLKDGKIKNLIPASKCAAGSGEFIVQQLQRMGLSLDEGIRESGKGNIIPLSTRCSVYCKSDATHKLNKGESTPADIAKTLIANLADRVCTMVNSARWPKHSIVLAGGLILNKAFVNSLKSKLLDSKFYILNESPFFEAFGAALLASELSSSVSPIYGILKKNKSNWNTLLPLKNAEANLDYRVKNDNSREIVSGDRYILGVDAGSTTTKAILFNMAKGTVDAAIYLRTHGNPVLAVKNCLHELIGQVGDKQITIAQCAVTGSGRELVSVFLGNCLSINEILAHARASSDVVPDVDTVFEIGGQDSKFISFLNGFPVDYAMNEGCSAGTGSFLEESVSVDMGIPVHDISSIAESSDNPLAFGERCSAFINTDLRNAIQDGASQENVIAGLVYSIANNYISRIVGVRPIGANLLFQGGVALNKSVALAIAALTKKRVVVPPDPELMGCIGCCLLARDLISDGDEVEKKYDLHSLVDGAMEVADTFLCKSCTNYCEIRRFNVRGETFPFGGLCSKFDLARHFKKGTIKKGKDLIEVRNKMMFEEFGQKRLKNSKGIIGIPLSLSSFEFYPFYSSLINELGYDLILSKTSKIGNSMTAGPICYPCEIAHGAVYDLLNRDVDFIFLPHPIENTIPDGALHSYICSSTAIMPNLIEKAFKGMSEKLLSPYIGFSHGLIKTSLEEIGTMCQKLGIDRKEGIKAGRKAFSFYFKFKERYLERGKRELELLQYKPTVIIAGKPYITCSSEVNIALPQKISSRGYNVIPADMLPPLGNKPHSRNVWHFAQQIMNAISYVKKYPNFYIAMISCFSCITDAPMYHLIRDELAGHTFCYLLIDSHTAHAGFDTRVGAFLDIIEAKERTLKRKIDRVPGFA
jgi:predicted CoA-substrate-specific enzyme activase